MKQRSGRVSVIDLDRKKILMIAPKYYGYEENIKTQLEKEGAQVYYIQENLENSKFLLRFIKQFNSSISQKMYTNYLYREVDQIKEVEFDYVFCIRINDFEISDIEYLKSIFKRAKFILYYWDSMKNMKNSVEKSKLFDKVMTFDRMDANENAIYGWIFRPLFYSDDFAETDYESDEKYDILSVATISDERVNTLLGIKEYCKNNNLSFFVKTVLLKSYYYKRRLFNSEFVQRIPENWLSFKSISKQELVWLMNKSRVILDITHSSQTGLTMRTIECIGKRKRLITTNKDVENYDFYNENDFLVVQDNDYSKIYDFCKKASGYSLSNEVRERYSLKNWVHEVFE